MTSFVLNVDLIAAIFGGYLLGSIPFGLVLTKAFGYGDIRAIGSGNIGATNVLRTGNKKLALATLVLDALKGAAAVLFVYLISRSLPESCLKILCAGESECGMCSLRQADIAMYLAGICAIIGHLFPIWLKFRGGKGVATALGTLLALKPFLGLMACALWLTSALITRYSSLSALIALCAAPFAAHFFYHDMAFTALCAVIALLVVIKHRANIQRLLRGEEPKIGKKN